MYQLQDSVLTVKGIGENLQKSLQEFKIENILDLLLFLPLRYEDRSSIRTIAEIKKLSSEATNIIHSEENQKVKTNYITTKAKLIKWNEYRKGRLLIGRATIADETEQIACLWFNNKYLKNKMVVGQEYFFSGNIKDGTLMQATVEKVNEDENQIHTGRLVPIYSQLADIKQGNLRRILAEVISKMYKSEEAEQIFRDLHFPAEINRIIAAREQLAMEEMLYLIQKSALLKKEHQSKKAIFSLKEKLKINDLNLDLPFQLTKAQEKAVLDILDDLAQKSPMNRLLIGDVGSGKTIVAAIPAIALIESGQNVCLIAPTKILAQQHFNNLQNIFKKISFQLVNSENKLKKVDPNKASFFIGTHSLLGQLKNIKPSLVIYDEQQRFGVKHRQLDDYFSQSKKQAHLLSMTATPIPRSLMLSIFSHLDLSYLDQMPNSREMATTWLVPKSKEKSALEWLVKELSTTASDERKKQALIICPFINPSAYKAMENVAAVKDTLDSIQKELKIIYQKLNLNKKNQLKIESLHSKLTKAEQKRIIEDVYSQKIQILVSTPMVEVGVDLPNADIIIIQSAERFGLSSLHQLRGRVGRKGQKSFCLLFSSLNSSPDKRLKDFCKEKDGLKLAQIDLENRGAGDILGYQQSGLNNLHFASWQNSTIILQAQKRIEHDPNHHSFLTEYLEKNTQSDSVKTATN